MRTLTIQGTQVPALGFGTWQLTGDQCVRSVADALEVGYRHIDTAQMYANEAEVGEAVAASGVDRDELFVTTKIRGSALAHDAVLSSTESSLRRLRMDYIDLLLIHSPTTRVPLEETLDAMLQLRDAGKIRHVGVSNFDADLVERAVAHAPVFADQVEYHPVREQTMLRALADKYDFTLTAYSPLAHGRLVDHPTLHDIAEAQGATTTQVALAWLLRQERVSAVPKATSRQHIEDNFGALEVELTEEQVARIDDMARQ